MITRRTPPRTLITGGAGFVGANLADRLLTAGHTVRVLDNLSRAGVSRNLEWLERRHGDRLEVIVADVRDASAVARAVRRCDTIYHFAAQVAVTTSLDDPREDFAINAGGTLNVLEAARTQVQPPKVIFTSTNKVYGALDDIEIVAEEQRYLPASGELRRGISERRPLDFHSPYGCSKGAADQYVLDYARSFGIPALVFRMSCIYGPRQFGTEDQGWVAHFLIRAIEREPITLYGDGRQVRDILFVEDLLDAFQLAEGHVERLAGQAFNIGGGAENAISLRELIGLIEAMHGGAPPVTAAEWRTGDQRYYVSDTSRFHAETGWGPKVRVAEGVERLYHWLLEARGMPVARVELEDVQVPVGAATNGSNGSHGARIFDSSDMR